MMHRLNLAALCVSSREGSPWAYAMLSLPSMHTPVPPCQPSQTSAVPAVGSPSEQTMLGAWDKNSGAGVDMASPLAQTVAANKLAHSYMAFNTNYHDTGEAGGRKGGGGVPGQTWTRAGRRAPPTAS